MTSSQLVWEGFLYGLTLTILLGPIFVALTQTGIEKGFRAGFFVGTGIWVSDILIISILYLLIGNIDPGDFEGDFQKYFGLSGGLILIIFGIGTANKKVDFLDEKPVFSAKNIFGYWLKGFLVNTVNPFTFIFWTTLMTAYVVAKSLSLNESILFFGSIMLTIMITDVLKVVGSKAIRSKLNKDYVQLISKIAGIALILFGIALIFRSWT